MKRDARIGLAVVAVFGLTVSLLVGRVIYKRSQALAGNLQPRSADYRAALEDATIRSDKAYDYFRPAGAAAPTSPGEQPAGRNAAYKVAERIDRRLSEESAPPPKTAARRVATNTSSAGRIAAGSAGGTPRAAAVPDLMQPHVYTVGKDDGSIWEISRKLYGDGKYAPQVVAANPRLNPRRLRAGMKIKIPPVRGVVLRRNLSVWNETDEITTRRTAVASRELRTESAPPPEVSPETSAVLSASRTVRVVHGERSTSSSSGMSVLGRRGGIHVVRPGDTLGDIAKLHYGSAAPKWIRKLRKANPGVDPRRMRVGKKLNVPAAGS